jgi:heat-inducible transcriptional repressor
MEFVWLGPGRAMVVLISDEGMVENRILEIHPSLEAHHLQEASNYLNHRLAGKKLPEARLLIEKELQDHQAQLDKMAAEVVSKGLAVWSGDREKHSLIVRGQSNLLKSVRDMEELDKIQSLFTALDTKEAFLDLLNATIDADGVQIFIGSESPLFHVSGCTVVVAPYTNEKGLLGAIGVIGPIHMNYRRIIPMVDYTARLLGRILGA